MSAGEQLRRTLDEALARASRDVGRSLEWSEHERITIARAIECADRAEALRGRFDALVASEEANDTALVKLAAELRLCDRQVVDLVARVNPGIGQAKSARHVAAARSRWDRAS